MSVKNEKTLVTMEKSRQAAYIIMSPVTGDHTGGPSPWSGGRGSYFIVTPLSILGTPWLEIQGETVIETFLFSHLMIKQLHVVMFYLNKEIPVVYKVKSNDARVN